MSKLEVYVLRKDNLIFNFRNESFEKPDIYLSLENIMVYRSGAIPFRNKYGGKIEKTILKDVV